MVKLVIKKVPNAKNAKKTCQIICFCEKSAFPFCYGAAQCWDTDAITQKRWKVKVHVQTSALLLLQKMVMNLFNKTHNRWNPNQSYLNFYLSFSETVTPGAKVSATELPTQRAMRNPAKPLLKTMSRMVISIKVLARIYFTIVDKFESILDIFPAFLNLHVHMARIFPFRLFHLTRKFLQGLESVNSNFTLAVRLPKFCQAKTQFLSHHNVCYINRFANFLTRDQWRLLHAWSTSDLLVVGSNPGITIFFLFFSQNETKSESWPGWILVSVLPE